MYFKLKTNVEAYENFINQLNTPIQLIRDAKEELINQGIKTKFTIEDLKKGEFVKAFHTHYKSQQKKLVPGSIYDEFLKLYGKTPNLLEEIETNYKYWYDKEFTFYEVNNLFYEYHSYRQQNNDSVLIMESAPKKRVFKLLDLISINKDNVQINVPEEYFTFYATNKKQLQIIKDVEEFVKISKNLNLEYSKIKNCIDSYLLKPNNRPNNQNQKPSLSLDLSIINLDYNKILTIK